MVRPKKSVINVSSRIPSETFNKLIERSQRRGMNICEYVRWCIEQQVERRR